MKLNCIIDTCSCLCLSHAEFKQTTLLSYFNEKATLNYSNEIHAELRDHQSKGLPTFILDKKRRIGTERFTMAEYERRLIGRAIPSREKGGNKGEIDNYAVSVDQIHRMKKNSIIFITDDKSALRGVLADWVNVCPVIKIWSSYEVVLYLYAEDIIPSKEIAVELIQSIIAFTAPKPKDRSEKTTAELIAVKRDYTKRIEKIRNLLK